jgi:hypothetical protein
VAAQETELEPVAVGFAWERAAGAESCPDREALVRGVETRLERAVFAGSEEAAVTVEGTIAPAERGFHASLVMRERGGAVIGSRELDADSERCETLADTLALVLALMVDVAEEHVRLHEPETVAAPAPPSPPPQPPPPAPEAEPRRSFRLDASIGAALLVELLPGVSIGPRLTASAEPPRFWPIQIEARIAALGETTLEGSGGAGAEFLAWMIGLDLCPRVARAGPITVRVCAGARGGQIRASGFGLRRNESATRALAVALARVEGWLRVAEPVALLLGVGAAVPFQRDRFTVRLPDGSSTLLHRPAPVSFTADLGLGVTIP